MATCKITSVEFNIVNLLSCIKINAPISNCVSLKLVCHTYTLHCMDILLKKGVKQNKTKTAIFSCVYSHITTGLVSYPKWLARASGLPRFTSVVLKWQKKKKKIEESQTFRVPSIPKWTQKLLDFVDQWFAQQIFKKSFYTGYISKGWHGSHCRRVPLGKTP